MPSTKPKSIPNPSCPQLLRVGTTNCLGRYPCRSLADSLNNKWANKEGLRYIWAHTQKLWKGIIERKSLYSDNRSWSWGNQSSCSTFLWITIHNKSWCCIYSEVWDPQRWLKGRQIDYFTFVAPSCGITKITCTAISQCWARINIQHNSSSEQGL